MKRVIVLALSVMLAAFPALGADDDSTPYMPYPETPPKAQPAPAKKAAPKKKAPAKKPAPKKPAPKKTVKRAPARPSSLQQGIALMQQDRYEQAKPYLLRAIQENRNDPNAWYWYGVYHEKTGGFHQAQYFYSKAVTIDPAFEPLSRVVFYPEDPEKTPLWDPKRPARVYPVEVASTGGMTTVPAGRSSFPTAPNDPELPHVPVYTPPEPGSAPFDGDAWAPAVYVPPSPEEAMNEGEHSPAYIPPQPAGIVADNPQTARQMVEIPVVRYPEGYVPEQTAAVRPDEVRRADKPLYTPPKPGEKAPTPPKAAKQKTAATPKKAAPAKTPTVTTPKKSSTVPASRVVRQTPQKTASRTRRAPAQPARPRQTASRDVTPARPAQPATPSAPSRTPEPVTLPPEYVPETRPQNQPYIPPVGQNAPDPGTIPDTPIPPVNQQ